MRLISLQRCHIRRTPTTVGTEHRLWEFVSRRGGGGELGGAAMPRLAATADRIDYWIRRRVVPCPVHSKVNPSFERFVGLTAIAQSLRDQYDALAPPMPGHLAALVEQLKTESHRKLAAA
jgi:hypothetical protein